MSARWVSVLVGGWLAMSAWLLPEGLEVRWIQFVAGAAIFLVAVVAMGVRRARLLNTAVALVAVLTPFVLGMRQVGAGANLVASGLVALGASLVPGRSGAGRPT